MSYLYGDSTPSSLDRNYIQFLRDVVDLLVAVLLADHRSRTTREKAITSRSSAEKNLEQLHAFSNQVTKMLEEAAAGAEPSGPTGQCAQQIRTASAEAIRKTATTIKSTLSSDLSRLESQMKVDRTGCSKAIETFILKHDLPGSVHRLELRLDNDRYRARLSGSSKEALSWVVDLNIPDDNLFSSPVRVDRVMDQLEIKVPELSGLVRKSIKLTSRKLTGKYITGLVHTATESTLRLRVSPTDDSGFDLAVSGSRAKLTFQGKEAQGHTEPFEPSPEDSAKLVELYSKAFEAASEVKKQRSKLVDARIDGKPLADHENPAILVQRVVARIAPAVQEISLHSQSPKELVLKRVLANDRREEIFVSKADLMAKLDPIPMELRGLFAPLGLGDLETGAVAAPLARSSGNTMPPPAPSAFRTGPATRPPMVGDDEPTAINVAKAAQGTITIQADAPNGGPPRPPPGAGKKGATQPGVPAPQAPGDKDIEVNIDDALAALESETG